jgi:hypothetical protein
MPGRKNDREMRRTRYTFQPAHLVWKVGESTLRNLGQDGPHITKRPSRVTPPSSFPSSKITLDWPKCSKPIHDVSLRDDGGTNVSLTWTIRIPLDFALDIEGETAANTELKNMV